MTTTREALLAALPCEIDLEQVAWRLATFGLFARGLVTFEVIEDGPRTLEDPEAAPLWEVAAVCLSARRIRVSRRAE